MKKIFFGYIVLFLCIFLFLTIKIYNGGFSLENPNKIKQISYEISQRLNENNNEKHYKYISTFQIVYADIIPSKYLKGYYIFDKNENRLSVVPYNDGKGFRLILNFKSSDKCEAVFSSLFEEHNIYAINDFKINDLTNVSKFKICKDDTLTLDYLN